MDLNVKCKTVEHSELNTGENLRSLESELSDVTLKARSIKVKNDKMPIFKLKNLYSVKDLVKRIKRQVTGYEKIFINHI